MRTGDTRRLVLAAHLAFFGQVACTSPTSPTAPTPVPAGYTGEWVGATEHGTPVRISVSNANEVTAVAVTYTFSGTCSGTFTYTDLSVPIRKLEPPAPPPFDQPGFTVGRNDTVTATAISGVFSADRRSVSGQYVLVGFSGCGPSVLGRWNADRR